MKGWIRSVFFSALAMITVAAKAQTFTPDVRFYIDVVEPVFVLADAKLIDGTGGPAREHQYILVRNGVIENVGSAADVNVPAGAKVISCTGKTVIPGLVMVHEHLYYTEFAGNYFNISQMPASFAKMYLAGGATTIRTAGSIEPQTDLAIKRMIEEGKLLGPDMDVTAPYIERTGFDIPALNVVKDSAEAAASVKFWADKGCTSFKMYMHARPEDLVAVAREAHKRGLKITGHLNVITYREAAELGIDNLEHGFMAATDFDAAKKVGEFSTGYSAALLRLPQNSPKMKDLIRLLVQKKVALTSTLPVFEPYTGREILLGGDTSVLLPALRADVVSRWQKRVGKDSAEQALFRKNMAWEKAFYDAGGLLLAGTDPTGAGRTVAGYGSRREIELLVEAGFTPMEAVKVATLNGAIYLGRSEQTGSIAAGKAADLVLIDGDLQADIKNIRNTELVFKKGIGFNSRRIFGSVRGKVGLN